MRRIALLFSITLMWLLCGCDNASEQMSELVAIDSLLNHQQKKEALQQLQLIDASNFNRSKRAYFHYLLTMAEYKNYVDIASDSIISLAVAHYQSEGPKDMYLKALIAQGCVDEVIGETEKAVECYHQAEDMASGNDTSLLAYAKLRLGSLYNTSYIGSNTIALLKYKEALSLYQAIGDRHYELVCLTKVGGLYRNIEEKHDSAVMYLKSAIGLAEEQKNDNYYFIDNFLLSEHYLVREKDYRTAIKYGRQALSVEPSVIEHPRTHYRLAESYLNMGQMDSATYFLHNAPRMMDASDSIVYYDVMSKLEHAKHDEGLSKHYMERAHGIADSVTISGLNHKLLAVEKKYDLQQGELENARLQSRLRDTWLVVAAIAIAALLSLLGLLRYRQRLLLKEHEQEMIKADLNASIASLRQTQSRLDNYERKLLSSEAACREQMSANETLEQERQQLTADIASLEAKKRQSDELRTIITQQVESVNQLMTWSYQYDAATFARKFREAMSIPAPKVVEKSYWANLQALVNDLYDNVLVRAQEAARGKLSKSELNLLALYCSGFSRTVIMVTMGYKHIGTVYNKKNQIAQKMGVSDLDDFLSHFER